jgi:hypothetical protein
VTLPNPRHLETDACTEERHNPTHEVRWTILPLHISGQSKSIKLMTKAIAELWKGARRTARFHYPAVSDSIPGAITFYE